MERLKQVWANYKEISPAFQKRKYSSDQLEADSNLSTASTNHDPELSRMYPDPVAQRPIIHQPEQPINLMMASVDHQLPNIQLVKHHDQNHSYPTDIMPPAVSHQMPCCPVKAPSMTIMNLRGTSTPKRDEASLVFPERQSQMRNLQPSCKEKSRSLDVLTLNDCPEQATVHPLNQTAPAVVADYHVNPSLAANEHLGNRFDNPLHTSSRLNLASMYRNQGVSNPRNSPNQHQLINTSHNPEIWINPTSSPTMRPLDTTHLSTIPLSSMTRPNTMNMAINSTCKNHMTNRNTINSNSTRIIYNHMMHSSTPLSKYMMNQAIPPSSLYSLHPGNLNQHQQPHQSSCRNKQKAAEMWATRALETPREALETLQHQMEPKSPCTSNPQVPLTSKDHCYNSLPRQLPESCHFQPIESYPSLSISSPSLFGTSPETSLTPSPTTTVLKNYNTASPNPQ